METGQEKTLSSVSGIFSNDNVLKIPFPPTVGDLKSEVEMTLRTDIVRLRQMINKLNAESPNITTTSLAFGPLAVFTKNIFSLEN